MTRRFHDGWMDFKSALFLNKSRHFRVGEKKKKTVIYFRENASGAQ